VEVLDRRSGVKLDAAKLDHELGRRAMTAYDLAQLSGVGEGTLSRARNGHTVQPGTLRRITAALLAAPILDGADLLLAQPGQERTARASTLAVQATGGQGSGQPAAR